MVVNAAQLATYSQAKQLLLTTCNGSILVYPFIHSTIYVSILLSVQLSIHPFFLASLFL